MKVHRIAFGALVLVFSFGTVAPQFAQEPSTLDKSAEDHDTLVGLVRTINTAEVTEAAEYGSFASWQTLYAHHADDLNEWLTKIYSRDPHAHFAEPPEILPGWNLRLNVQTDGKGFVLLLDDTNDKSGFAAVSDERGIIWLCKYLQ